MGIILKMTFVGTAMAFWGFIVGIAYVTLPQTEGTLMWCKANSMMSQPICAPYSMKLKRNQ